VGIAIMPKSDDERRALALSSGLGTKALVFDEKDVVDLLRIAIEREGSQSAFARRSGVNRSYLNRVLTGKKPAYDTIAEALGLRRVYMVK
jgi:predicted transcriptional regulator